MSKARQRCIRSHGVRLPGISLGFQRRDCGGTGGQSVAEFFDLIFRVYGPLDLSLSPLTAPNLRTGFFARGHLRRRSGVGCISRRCLSLFRRIR